MNQSHLKNIIAQQQKEITYLKKVNSLLTHEINQLFHQKHTIKEYHHKIKHNEEVLSKNLDAIICQQIDWMYTFYQQACNILIAVQTQQNSEALQQQLQNFIERYDKIFKNNNELAARQAMKQAIGLSSS